MYQIISSSFNQTGDLTFKVFSYYAVAELEMQKELEHLSLDNKKTQYQYRLTHWYVSLSLCQEPLATVF